MRQPPLLAAPDGDPVQAHKRRRSNGANSTWPVFLERAAGLERESLDKALSAERNPELATVLKVMRALGLKLK
jgi:hypothetical protein